MKKLITSLLVVSLLVFAGCTWFTPDDEETNTNVEQNENANQNENVNENVNENENLNENLNNNFDVNSAANKFFLGEWTLATEGVEGKIYTTVIVNDDPLIEIPGQYNGTVDSTKSQVVGQGIDETVELTEDFGIYTIEGRNFVIEAANNSTTFTGEFTSDHSAQGTWINSNNGQTGNWVALKVE